MVGDLEGVEGDPHADAAHVVAEGVAPLPVAGQALALQERPQVGGEDLLHLQVDAAQVEGGEAQPPVPGGRQEDAVAGEAQLRVAVGEPDLLPRGFLGAGAPAAADPGVDHQLVAAAVGELPVHEDLLARGLQADLRPGHLHLHQPLHVLARVQLVGEHQHQARNVSRLVLVHLLQPHLLHGSQGDLLLVRVGDLQLLVVHGQHVALIGRVPLHDGAGEGEDPALLVRLPGQGQEVLPPAQGRGLPHGAKVRLLRQLQAAAVDQVLRVSGRPQVEVPFEGEDLAAGDGEVEVQGLEVGAVRQQGRQIQAAPVGLARGQGPVGAEDQVPGALPPGRAVDGRGEGEDPLLQGVVEEAAVDDALHEADLDGTAGGHRPRGHRAHQPGRLGRHGGGQVLHRLPGAAEGQDHGQKQEGRPGDRRAPSAGSQDLPFPVHDSSVRQAPAAQTNRYP